MRCGRDVTISSISVRPQWSLLRRRWMSLEVRSRSLKGEGVLEVEVMEEEEEKEEEGIINDLDAERLSMFTRHGQHLSSHCVLMYRRMKFKQAKSSSVPPLQVSSQ
jgi:hypothetical protein